MRSHDEQVLDPFESIVKVHSGLEVLRAAGKTVSLVLMPDFNIFSPQADDSPGPAPPEDGWGRIGAVKKCFQGHAGIGTAALAALRIRGDQPFKVLPILKTGRQGAGLFEELLDELYRVTRCEQIATQFVLADGQDRAMTYTLRDGKPKRGLEDLREEGQIRLEELQQHEGHPVDLLKSCSGLGFLSLEHEAIDQLLHSCFKKNSAKPVIITDAGGINEAANRATCLRRLKRLSQLLDFVSFSARDAATYANVIAQQKSEPLVFPEDRSLTPHEAYQAANQISKEAGIAVLLHHESYTAVIRTTGDSQIVPTFRIHPADTDGAGDTLNAGFLLASAVRRSLSLLAESAKQWRWEVPHITEPDCLVYATVLTSARLSRGYFVTYKEMVEFAQSARWRDIHRKASFRWASADGIRIMGTRKATRMVGEQKCLAAIEDQDRLITERLRAVAELCQSNSYRALTSVVDVPCVATATMALCALRCCRQSSDRRVVFVDLDGTLFDSPFAREMAGDAALRRLCLGNDTMQRCQMFREIYKDWQFFGVLLGEEPPNDFRQNWGTGNFFKSLIYCFREQRFDPDAQKVNEHYARLKPSFDREGFKEWVRNCPENDVQDAVRAFRDYQFHPWSDARSVVQSLQEDLGLDVYLVTEGNRQCQLWKLHKLGLADVFGISGEVAPRVLCDDAFANPQHVSNDLRSARELIRHLPPAESEAEIRYLSALEKLLVTRIRKMRSTFHAIAIQAVLVSPKDPHQELLRLLRAAEPGKYACIDRPARLAVIGDRGDIDASPYKRVSDNIGTIRLLKGQYCPERRNDGSIVADPSPPDDEKHVDKLVHSLTEALAVLATSGFWDDHRSFVIPIQESDLPRLQPGEIQLLEEIINQTSIDALKGQAFALLHAAERE